MALKAHWEMVTVSKPSRAAKWNEQMTLPVWIQYDCNHINRNVRCAAFCRVQQGEGLITVDTGTAMR